MSAPAAGRRLAAIKICGYRGFPNPITVWLATHDSHGKLTGKGRNLLLYGENGSGKSSLGKAIRDFLDVRANSPRFDEYKYRHADPPRTDRSISLMFDDPTVDSLTWNPTDRDMAHPDFADMARSRGWLDYRVVWRASEVQYGDSVEIFQSLVEEILPNCVPSSASTVTFGQGWAKITEAAGKRPIKYGREWMEVQQLQRDVGQFNSWLETFLTDLERRANDLLKEFAPWTTIQLCWVVGASYDSAKRTREKLARGSVRLKMIDRGGGPLRAPSEFLNEARLTAVGLCLYLAGMSQSIPPRRTNGTTYPRLLILDDVLLSLDMSHRRPLLKLLGSDNFKDWQILLLTHDRAWYEIAKQELGDWARCELFAERVGDYDQPLLREDQDNLMQAIDFLVTGYIKAAAVHVRSKFEEVLKWGCHSLGLSVKYDPDPRKVSARDYWSAVEGATYDKIPPVHFARDAQGKAIWWQPKATSHHVVPKMLQDRINHALSWVMNPLSHSQSVERYRDEIEDAIFAVGDLEQAIKDALVMRQGGPVVLREMLLTMLRKQQEMLSALPNP